MCSVQKDDMHFLNVCFICNDVAAAGKPILIACTRQQRWPRPQRHICAENSVMWWDIHSIIIYRKIVQISVTEKQGEEEEEDIVKRCKNQQLNKELVCIANQ